jgi:hypothetical protein
MQTGNEHPTTAARLELTLRVRSACCRTLENKTNLGNNMELTLSTFFLDTPLYTPVQIDDSNRDVFGQIIEYQRGGEFHGYNPWSKMDSTFTVISDLIPTGSGFLTSGGYGEVRIKCKRSDHVFRFNVLWDPTTKILMKTGQHPSVADIHISEVKQYKKLLSDEKLRELTRAIGLAANGVGIGSFVYLRRVFEYLIQEAYEKCLSENLVTEDQYKKARMDEKINLLSAHLPVFLTENRAIYSILSLGIHELKEDVCLAHFDTLRVGIEIILDEKLDEFRKKEKIETAKKKLSQLQQKI